VSRPSAGLTTGTTATPFAARRVLPGRSYCLSDHLQETTAQSIAEDVRAGLTGDPRNLPSKYLYDARGSKLFEQICDLPEY
jgi:L-histidine N-alpha-methyltransferase